MQGKLGSGTLRVVWRYKCQPDREGWTAEARPVVQGQRGWGTAGLIAGGTELTQQWGVAP